MRYFSTQSNFDNLNELVKKNRSIKISSYQVKIVHNFHPGRKQFASTYRSSTVVTNYIFFIYFIVW